MLLIFFLSVIKDSSNSKHLVLTIMPAHCSKCLYGFLILSSQYIYVIVTITVLYAGGKPKNHRVWITCPKSQLEGRVVRIWTHSCESETLPSLLISRHSWLSKDGHGASENGGDNFRHLYFWTLIVWIQGRLLMLSKSRTQWKKHLTKNKRTGILLLMYLLTYIWSVQSKNKLLICELRW